jgi:amino acid permease
MDIADKAATFRLFMYFWAPKVSPYFWILIFYIFPVGFNLLNARRIGGIEFTFTAIKVFTLIGLIILGLVILAGGTGYNRPPLVGLDSNYNPVPCALNAVNAPCLSTDQGFKCTSIDT